MKTLFITGTGTGIGKTWVTRGLAKGLFDAGIRVAAIKPIETGVDDVAYDAAALAKACGQPDLARAAGFYRAKAPLSPLAASLEGEAACPSPKQLGTHCRAASLGAQLLLVEGAGGIKVPLDAAYTNADLIRELDATAILVAPNELGVLSHVLTAIDSARVESVRIGAIVLVDRLDGDLASRTNARILEAKTGFDVFVMPPTVDDDDALASACKTSKLLERAERFAKA